MRATPRLLAVLALAAGGGCVLTTSLTGLSGGARDAADDGGRDGPAPDAPAPDACCRCVTDPADDTSFSHWLAVGSAVSRSGFTELTAEKSGVAGALFWPAPGSLASFDVTFDFSITYSGATPDSPADGLAFLALDTTTLPSKCTGTAGSDMCFLGLAPGLGVVVRTFQGPSDPAIPYVGVITPARSLSSDAGTPLLDGGYARVDAGSVEALVSSTNTPAPPPESWHTMRIRVAARRLSVDLDGRPLLANVAVGAVSGLWGFVAATGGGYARHAIRKVTMVDRAPCGD